MAALTLSEVLKSLKSADPTSLNSDLLQALHLLTKDKKLNQDAARKLKQIFHLLNQLSPVLEKIFTQYDQPRIMDMGCGKAYLGFLINELLLKPLGRGEIIGIEFRDDLVSTCQSLAAKIGSKNLRFQNSKIEDIQPENIQILTALHACDTATDDSIALGIKHEIPVIALVPCCQAEIAQQLHTLPKSHLWPLWRHSFHTREFGSHLTNVIRSLVLESHGYKITVTEFTGWEHSLKNELIIAEKIQKGNSLAQKQLQKLLSEIPVCPAKLKDSIAIFS